MRRLHFLYHELRPRGSDYSYIVDTENFVKQMDLFVQLRAAGRSSLWPEVTFDDGHISNYDYALPILQSRGVTARFFITVGWTGKKAGYMGWPELRSLHESGHAIGAHSWSHALLTHCTQKDLYKELSGARLTLEDNLGTQVTAMSLPGGRFNRRVLAACVDAGYKQIYTSEPKAEEDPTGLTIGRLNVLGDMTLEWIRSVLQHESDELASLERRYRINAAAKRILGDWLYEKFWAILNRKEPDGDDAGTSVE